MARRVLRVGTRGSLLARTQTEWVTARLQRVHPDLHVEIRVIQTTGDLHQSVPFHQVGTRGMFVKEIEQALYDDVIDVGVHSLKDLPSVLPEGLELACIPEREDPLDALIAPKGQAVRLLPQGARVGTSSLRRRAQLRHFRPDLQVIELRGNLDTRLRKWEEGQYDAIVLACAGLRRLGLAGRITERIPLEVCVPAPGQGALGLEIRCGDRETRRLLAAVHDPDSADCVAAERSFLAAIEGGCSVPAGALATLQGDRLTLTVVLASPDGAWVRRHTISGARTEARQIGETAARVLLEAGE
ncbi:MAG: hydroxymethylbilane synthase [Chloroherpetonaceae bacterium]|nr:hydroxymethylbilane synthase [Chthonomonadaceae bacterium]MDW8208197.1 hydroxymethylbilane synthase [Chloroherpetonaceae bacterium]